ncbi:hypothetical protein AGLY_013514 [Aphis glycines]|uniref:Uncharacterized protein n=1 Tax=Aphis glycines TaxID=307491 RepID=A0A6G0T757_APHGL|nr:hypothetical protein AGLY_013514 [Aphis glycines]
MLCEFEVFTKFYLSKQPPRFSTIFLKLMFRVISYRFQMYTYGVNLNRYLSPFQHHYKSINLQNTLHFRKFLKLVCLFLDSIQNIENLIDFSMCFSTFFDTFNKSKIFNINEYFNLFIDYCFIISQTILLIMMDDGQSGLIKNKNSIIWKYVKYKCKMIKKYNIEKIVKKLHLIILKSVIYKVYAFRTLT